MPTIKKVENAINSLEIEGLGTIKKFTEIYKIGDDEIITYEVANIFPKTIKVWKYDRANTNGRNTFYINVGALSSGYYLSFDMASIALYKDVKRRYQVQVNSLEKSIRDTRKREATEISKIDMKHLTKTYPQYFI